MKWLPSVCLLLLIPVLSGCDSKVPEKKEQIRPVSAIQVGKLDKVSGRKFPGKAKATQEINLAFDVGGKLIERPVNIGDEVKKGDIIAKLNPRDFNAKVKSAKSELKKTARNFDRAKKLITDGYISQSEYDRIETAVDVAEAKLDIAKKALKDSVIKAPFDGHIADLYVENYQAVQQKKVIARLLDTSQVEMIVQISESLISKVSYMENIQVTFDSFPDNPLAATIKEVSNEASQTTRTYPVTLIMKQHENIKILPGMAGNATGILVLPGAKNKAGEFVIPVKAVFTPNTKKQDHVWVIDENSGVAKLREVKTGLLTGSGIQIIDGLQAGEWVATAGVHFLHEDQKVRIDTNIVTE